MKITILLLLALTILSAPLEQVFVSNIPTMIEAASIARTLVERESLMNINTIKSRKGEGGELKRIPVSSMEYYADCDEDGDPYWLVVDLGSTFTNIKGGSEYSITIRTGDHALNDNVDPKYPGGIPESPSGSPRAIFEGKFVNVSFSNPLEMIRLERCFLKKHPDAKFWLPNSPFSAHSSHWTKFIVDDIYFIGGFGDRAYIGSIDADIYHSVGTLRD